MLYLYVKQQREELGLSHDHRCRLIFDAFNRQTIDELFKLLDKSNFACLFVPPNLTIYFHPLDLNVSNMPRRF